MQAIAFRSDGTVAATVDNAGVIRLWDAASGVLLGTLPATGELITFADDGDLLVGGVDGVGRYACDVCGDIGELLARAGERLGRQLTHEERATYLHGSGSRRGWDERTLLSSRLGEPTARRSRIRTAHESASDRPDP